MAKGLRSSSKLKARNQKRTNPKSDYAVAEAARLNALSTRLAAGLKKDKVPVETTDSDKEESKPKDTPLTKMAEDDDADAADAEPKKISTAGPRNSRRETYRKSKGLVPFKNKGGNKLFDAHKSKNGGILKRRR